MLLRKLRIVIAHCKTSFTVISPYAHDHAGIHPQQPYHFLGNPAPSSSPSIPFHFISSPTYRFTPLPSIFAPDPRLISRLHYFKIFDGRNFCDLSHRNRLSVSGDRDIRKRASWSVFGFEQISVSEYGLAFGFFRLTHKRSEPRKLTTSAQNRDDQRPTTDPFTTRKPRGENYCSILLLKPF